ncbi:flagellar hook assembly protein FlgD [Methylobacterium radiodurans]|uniref:Basal-body rod modification protein FlgD n=1 Tax=Methylobacterium radiodurans TaxID=2202828 RepID=A0A2U8VU38_9HYPH|nr:flagellar hook capping FlgD N-terminal domain-containing protein [Methylobacterium radiodurans]AWN36951.1 flagellar hook capping protein [Methylobacterium radiodurans]
MASGIAAAVGTATTTSKTGSGTSAQEIAGNFTQFLTLLTTQLKNQNPLDPMDTNQFTQQLVQFAGVEQQLKTNDRLESILTSSKAASTASATSYIGQTVEATGATADLKGGAATWTLTTDRAAPKATVTILDAKGNTVGTQSLSLTQGSQGYTWNGKNAAGISQPEGTYTLKIAAQDATGTQVSVKTGVSGKVDEVDLSGSEPVLVIGNNRVPLSSVTSVGFSTTSG